MKSIGQAFGDVEQAFKAIFQDNIQNIDYQRVGTCALATISNYKRVVVANSGDCEGAVLGVAPPLKINKRHNAGEPAEQQRLQKAFPNQPDIYECIPNTSYCYVKGRLQPTRSIGDFYLKEPEYNFTGISTFTGPYITQVPEVSMIPMDNGKYCTLVLATDGLWDELSLQEIDAMHRTTALIDSLPKRLGNAAIKKVLDRNDLTLKQLAKLPNARDLHDDISIVVVNLEAVFRDYYFETIGGDL